MDIQQFFYRYANTASERVRASGSRFAYYTSAETASRILQSKSVWMRSTRTMNDYLEVEHGIECVYNALDSENGSSFRQALDSVFPDLTEEVLSLYRGWIPGFEQDTYITCVSEHTRADDRLGRLSMWRAYGGRAGVALVLNGAPMFASSSILGAYSSPVAYLDTAGVSEQLQASADYLKENVKALGLISRADARNHLFNMLRMASVCTKHPGFEEEREWRIVASPRLQYSEHLPPSVEVVDGIPQTVLKLPLRDFPEDGLVGLELRQLIDRVIVGPTEYPDVIGKAFTELLAAAGVQEPHKKVFVSAIPLRDYRR